jgi:hypothetical protein
VVINTTNNVVLTVYTLVMIGKEQNVVRVMKPTSTSTCFGLASCPSSGGNNVCIIYATVGTCTF